jgi:hypothetical protein
MALIKNLTSQGVDLVVRGEAKDGVPPTEHVGPGQTRELDVDISGPRIKGMVVGGLISVAEPALVSRAAVAAKSQQPSTHEGKAK